MATMRTSAVQAIKDLVPALATCEDNVREARRVIVNGRHAAEDFVAETALQVRRHPLRAIVFAAGAGALVGSLIGFALGRRVPVRG
jgi:ElaB/YqjD/DUF883 family membrane-anchored ribosome-binding protein